MNYTLDYIYKALSNNQTRLDAFKDYFSDKDKWREIRTKDFYKNFIDNLNQREGELKDLPIPNLTFSLYKLYDTNGNRREYEDEYFRRREILITYTLLSLIYPENDYYINHLEDIIWAICDEYTWCLPAHLYQKSLIPVESCQDITKSRRRPHREVIDLFSAETGFGISETISILRDRLSPIVYSRAKSEVSQRILKPFMDINSFFHWETLDMNWASVCAGSVGAVAMYLIDEGSVLAPIIERCMHSMECFLSGFGEDGVCMEGIDYWNYGFGFFTYFSELLLRRTDSLINLFDSKKVEKIANFHQVAYLSENSVITFSDSHPYAYYNVSLGHFFNKIYNTQISDKKYSAGIYHDHCFRSAPAIRSFIWANPDLNASKRQVKTEFLDSAQWFVGKYEYENKQISLVAKGGNNAEPHNHNDLGSFIVNCNGKSLLTDLGYGEYTKDYFQKDIRYTFLCNGSQGHSVPIIDTNLQKPGLEYKAEILEYFTDKSKDIFELEISNAYGVKNLNSLVRRFVVDKTTGISIKMKDSFVFDKKPKEVIDRMISLFEPKVNENILIIDSLKIIFDSKIFDCRIEKTSYLDHFSVSVDVYLIDFIFRNTLNSLVAEFEFLF